MSTSDSKDRHLSILYKDDSIVAVYKPAGWLVHKTNIAASAVGTEEHYVLQTLRDQLGAHVFPVHRLDRATSGVLLFALSSSVATQLSEQFAERQVEKEYWALTRGWIAAPAIDAKKSDTKTGDAKAVLEQFQKQSMDFHIPRIDTSDVIEARYRRLNDEDWLLVDHPLNKPVSHLSRQQKIKRQVESAHGDTDSNHGRKEALTRYRPFCHIELSHGVGRYATARYTLVALKPLTGRPHQLRRHMKHIAHPIVGDVKYGRGEHNKLYSHTLGLDGLMLLAKSLSCSHPVTGRPLTIDVSPQGSLLKLLQLLPENCFN